MKKLLKIFLIFLLIIALFALNAIWQSGSFKTIENNFAGPSQKIVGLAGVEDITIDQTTGIAFLSSDDRWAKLFRKQPTKGAIYTLNLNDSIPHPLSMTAHFADENFHPHGISFYQTPEGKKMLFVVNHKQLDNTIEIFEYRNDSLLHQKTISDALLVSPNDVVGVGENAFYFTNDHNEKASKWRGIKDLLTIGTGNVCYFDGQKMHSTSIEGIKYANGINISADGKKLYVASTSGKKILFYDRDIATGMLTKSSEWDANTGVDNIELDTEGNLWVGCHPQMLKFLSHAKDESKWSPSEIIKLTMLSNGQIVQKTIYMNDGSEISGSSVGAVYKDKLVIGPVFQNHIVLGRMK